MIVSRPLSFRFLIAFLGAALVGLPAVGSDIIDLAGPWLIRVDRAAVAGVDAEPIAANEKSLRLPGSMQEQGFGDEVTVEAQWTPDLHARSRYYKGPEFAPYREPGNIKVPFALQPKRMYVGAASYQREIIIPADWAGRRAVLWFERPHWFTEVWLDGQLIGAGDSLSVPHEFELPSDIAPGAHQLLVRVDNRLRVDVGDNSHSVSDHTQTNWNGMVGGIELRSTPPVWIEHVQATPDLQKKQFLVRATVGNETGMEARVSLGAIAKLRGDESKDRSANTQATVPVGGGEVEFAIQLGVEAPVWDEFNPSVYDLDVKLEAEGVGAHSKMIAAGLREVGIAGTRITVNGRPVFMRGTLECCVFPRTGYPPVDVASWKKVFERCQEFGLNHVRFHSYCPPEAAFDAADELGVYLQVEAACWAVVGDGKPVDGWIYAETERILREYGNHPSFVMMAYGNEPYPNKPTRDRFLADWVTHFKQTDPRRVYSCASGWPTLKESDYHVLPQPRLHQWGEQLKSRLNADPPTTVPDYGDFVRKHDRPVVAHEIGQWCVYPDLDERSKYTGVTQAKNFDIFADMLRNAGMGSLARPFLMASGALQELCYKEEIEAALRTPGFGGFQLLGLNDFPGQGTALVGLCDAFWDVKPYASAERFREFCRETVPLARLPKRILSTSEPLVADVEVAHFGPEALAPALWKWRLTNGRQTVQSGQFSSGEISTGKNTNLGSISASLASLTAPAACELLVEGPSGIRNSWRVWAYPSQTKAAPAAVEVVSTLEAASAALDRGGRVLLLADPTTVKSEVVLGFSPIFWNTAWTDNQPPHGLGLLIENSSAAFAGFPTASHQDWQWWEMLKGCRAMELDGLPSELQPLVQVIPDWAAPKRLALVFEARVGSGRLLVVSADLGSDLKNRHAARAMRESLLAYAAGDDFAPSVELTTDQLAGLFAPKP